MIVRYVISFSTSIVSFLSKVNDIFLWFGLFIDIYMLLKKAHINNEVDGIAKSINDSFTYI